MARKSKALSPRRKRMSRHARLQSARRWLETFAGKRVVPSYARWFGVDLMCAVKELQMLGRRFSPEYLEQLRRTAAGPKHRRDAANGVNAAGCEPMSDHHFAYIAGLTPAGFPFGVTWEEAEGLDGDDVPFTTDDVGTDDF